MTTDGAQSFFPGVVDGPLTIKLAKEHAFRVAGKVVDAHGRPVRATVDVTWKWQVQEQYEPSHRGPRARPAKHRFQRTPGHAPRAESGEDGAFLTDGLWPGEPYRLTIAADGYETRELALLSGAAGSTFDTEALVLRRKSLAVEGRVVDVDGQPVEHASVFNSGDARAADGGNRCGRPVSNGRTVGGTGLLSPSQAGLLARRTRCAAGEVSRQARLVDDRAIGPGRGCRHRLICVVRPSIASSRNGC